MKVAVLAAAACTLFAFDLSANGFYTEVGLYIRESTENLLSAGLAQHFNTFGEETAVQCRIYHDIEENGTYIAAGGFERLRTTPYNESIESWIGGNIESCYVAHVSARNDTGASASESASICYYGPPEPIEYSSVICPLILDLNGDGIHTTGLEDPVRFWDLNNDGYRNGSGWIDPDTEEAFLWLDTQTDHRVDQHELFGSAMVAPDGGFHKNGFQALEKFDTPEYGGNGDGAITPGDRVWGRLRLWNDKNHDGKSQPTEIDTLGSHGVVSLGLARVHDHSVDRNGNSAMLVGKYLKRVDGNHVQELPLVDISFAFQTDPEPQ